MPLPFFPFSPLTAACARCLHVRYRHTALKLRDLHRSCPMCRGVCSCKQCLRRPEHAGRLQTWTYTEQQLEGFAAYMVKVIGGPLAEWLQEQSTEVGRDRLHTHAFLYGDGWHV